LPLLAHHFLRILEFLHPKKGYSLLSESRDRLARPVSRKKVGDATDCVTPR
jgi:hypothetical protein